MTTTTPAKKTTVRKATTPVTDVPSPEAGARTSAKKATVAKKTTVAKRPEFAPTVKDTGRLDHTNCGHLRTFAGRSACRAAMKKAAEADK